MNLAVRTVLANAHTNAASICTCGALNEQRGGQRLPQAAAQKVLSGAIALVLRNALQLPTPNNSGDCVAVGRSRPARDGAGSTDGGGGGTSCVGIAGCSGGGTGLPAPPHVRRQRRVMERWQAHEMEVVIAAVRAERAASCGPGQEGVPGVQQASRPQQQQGSAAAKPPGEARRVNIRGLMAQLGWDPSDVWRRDRLHRKVNELRAKLDNGEEVSAKRKRHDRDRAVHWAAWCRSVFLGMPLYEGTADDVCAALQADPHIAPLLDHRVYATQRTVPRWRKQVVSTLPQIPGLIKTGEKKDKLFVYRYDPKAAELLAAVAMTRRRSSGGRRAASMPHLGLQQ